MKKLLWIVALMITVAHAMEGDRVIIAQVEMADDEYLLLREWLEAKNKAGVKERVFSVKSLQLLCINHMLNHPREYITCDAEQRLTKDVKDIIRKSWYNNEISLKKMTEIRRLHYYKEYSYNLNSYIDICPDDFLSNNIPLGQLLLLRACHRAEDKEEVLQLTPQEEKIFEDMDSIFQKTMQPFIKQSWWKWLSDILCT